MGDEKEKKAKQTQTSGEKNKRRSRSFKDLYTSRRSVKTSRVLHLTIKTFAALLKRNENFPKLSSFDVDRFLASF